MGLSLGRPWRSHRPNEWRFTGRRSRVRRNLGLAGRRLGSSRAVSWVPRGAESGRELARLFVGIDEHAGGPRENERGARAFVGVVDREGVDVKMREAHGELAAR